MPKLIIAEKPSVGRDLARVLGVRGSGRSSIENKGWVITWCVGHLVELVEPAAYHAEWRRWSMRTLPMLPERFQLRPVERTIDQFETVKRLLLRDDIDEVINACDAGREGELIFRYVYELAGADKPISRLWISSMTDEAIQTGFSKLRPGSDYDRLWDAARCRSEADWLVGLNATRAITVRARQALQVRRGPLFSVGRVQTPTLAMVVARELEIRNFVPQDYFVIKATFDGEAGSWVGRWFKGKADRFDTEEAAKAVVAAVDGQPGAVSRVTRKKAKEKPPFLFDLTRLQRAANKRFGFSAAHTLTVAQKLYETHKLLTYPRTDSSHLPSDMYKEVPRSIAALDMEPWAPFAQKLLSLKALPKSKRVFNDKKVSDHHAIIPTPKKPNARRLNPDEKKLYDMVARRFLAAFYPDAIFQKTEIITQVKGHSFRTRGKVSIDPGWREVMGWDDAGSSKKKGGDDSDDEESGLLPAVNKGDDALTRKTELEAKKTKPPSRYTEATLLAAMEGAGRLLDDEELAQAMKDSGLGTPATRASIIETLLGREYLRRKGKTLYPEDKGISLIEMIPAEGLTSPQLTGEWEARLAKMARGEEAERAATFMADVASFVKDLIAAVQSAPIAALAQAAASELPEGEAQRIEAVDPADVEGGLTHCPRCKGVVRAYPKVFGCRGPDGRSEGCGFRIFRIVAGKPLTEAMGKALIHKGRTQILKGFMSRKGSTFEARLLLQEGGDVTFDFPPREGDRRSRGVAARSAKGSRVAAPTAPAPPGTQTDLECPQCGLGTLVVGRKAWGCGRWREGCRFTVPFTFDGHNLAADEVAALIQKGKTEPIDGLVLPEGGVGWGYLFLDGDITEAQRGLTLRMRALADPNEAQAEGDDGQGSAAVADAPSAAEPPVLPEDV